MSDPTNPLTVSIELAKLALQKVDKHIENNPSEEGFAATRERLADAIDGLECSYFRVQIVKDVDINS
jgi:hypothetical protein